MQSSALVAGWLETHREASLRVPALDSVAWGLVVEVWAWNLVLFCLAQNLGHQPLPESDFLALPEGSEHPQPVQHGGPFPLPEMPAPSAVPSTEDYAGEHNFELLFKPSGMAKSVTCTVRVASAPRRAPRAPRPFLSFGGEGRVSPKSLVFSGQGRRWPPPLQVMWRLHSPLQESGRPQTAGVERRAAGKPSTPRA